MTGQEPGGGHLNMVGGEGGGMKEEEGLLSLNCRITPWLGSSTMKIGKNKFILCY